MTIERVNQDDKKLPEMNEKTQVARPDILLDHPDTSEQIEKYEFTDNDDRNCPKQFAVSYFLHCGFDVNITDPSTRKLISLDGRTTTLSEYFRQNPEHVPAMNLPESVIALVCKDIDYLMTYLKLVGAPPLVLLQNGSKHAALFRSPSAREITLNPLLPRNITLLRPGTLIRLPFDDDNLDKCLVHVHGPNELFEFPVEVLTEPPSEVKELINSHATSQTVPVVNHNVELVQERTLRDDADSTQSPLKSEVLEFENGLDYESKHQTVNNVADMDSMPPVPTNPLQKYSLLGSEDEVARAAVKVVALLGYVILMGQFAMIYAQPNTGKTLLVIALLLQAVEEGRLDPRMLYYVNADDNSAGIIEKLEPFREIGAHTLVPGYKGFEPENLIEMMLAMIKDNQCTGIVVVVDTLKSFIDLMDKKKSAQFGRVVRRFQHAGGTFIGIAHLNKNPGRNGKPIYAGTSDFHEACDVACYLLPVENKEQADKIVRFELFKKRGGGNRDEAYSFSGANNISYDQLVASVQKIDPDQMHKYERSAQIIADQSVIEGICTVLKNGPMQKMALAKAVASLSKATRRHVIEILERYTGSDPAIHKWDFAVAERGAKVFTLHPASES